MKCIRGARALSLLLLLPGLAHAQPANSYTQTNLISDGSVTAQSTDKTLINPWGIAIGQQTPFWINDAGSGISAIVDAAGHKQFTVKIPSAGPGTATGTPTGIAFNATSDFALSTGGPALFVFDNLDGSISAWNAALTDAQRKVDNSAHGAVYTGLAIVNNAAGNFLLAANLGTDAIDVFDTKFAPATLAGNFTDPTLPAGYAPFNVHVLNGQVYVLYAQQTPGGGPPTPGPGAGYVSVFDNSGNLVQRAISGGALNAPWGLALAPSGFGAFGGDLLVGNFGDGTINVYDPKTFASLGQLQDANGKPIQNDRLWEILFGQNGTGDPNTLYFSAGVNDEKGGLFGSIAAAAPAGTADFQLAVSAAALTIAAGKPATVQLSVAPSNGFTGPVTFSASGLPAGVSAQFSPTSVTPAAGQPADTTVTLAAGTASTPSSPYATGRSTHLTRGIAAATLVPFGLACLLPVWRRRRGDALSRTGLFRALVTVATLSLTLGGAAVLSGCGGSSTPAAMPSAPGAGPTAATITLVATSGALSHSTTLALTVQ